MTLELTMEELAETTAMIEDMPALVVFIVEMVAFPQDIRWVSAATGVVSGVMLGRKYSGGAKKAELIALKRDLEEELGALALEGGGGEGRRSIGGSMRAVESVFGAGVAREKEAEVDELLGDGGDIEMASAQETRPAELPLPGAVNDEEGEEEGAGGGMREQLAERDRVIEGLRRRVQVLEGGGGGDS